MREGTKLNHYEILAPLGEGGMGQVYKARDTRLDREVAIKVLPDELASDDKLVQLFEREARLLASLNHTNIATIYGVEQCDDVRFLAMELIDGDSLRDKLDRGTPPVGRALEICRQVASAIEAAHGKGIVHRDLKPTNILVTGDGQVKVIDFGIAKSVGEGTEDPDTQPTLVTVTGAVVGTAPYMSPEQARGAAVDQRSDVWAFGCVLYECLTGEPAFERETTADTVSAILEHDPDWSLLPAATPAGVGTLLQRALRKDPALRPRDIRDIRIELDETVTALQSTTGEIAAPTSVAGGDAPASTPPVGSLSGGASTATTATAPMGFRAVPWIIAVGAIAWALWPSPPEGATATGVQRFALTPPEGTLPTPTSQDGSIAVSADGSLFAFIAAAPGDPTRLFLKRIDQAGATPLSGTEGAGGPFFSPDGRWVGFFADDQLKKVSITGGAPLTLAPAPEPRGGTWSVDGRIVFSATNNDGLQVISEDGGAAEVLTTPDPETEWHHHWPSFLPGDRAILLSIEASDTANSDDSLVAVRDLVTGEQRILVEGGNTPRYVPTGHVVYARDGAMRAIPFDLATLEGGSPSFEVVGDLTTFRTQGAAQFGFSETGTLVYVPGEAESPRRLVWVARDGSVEPISDEERGFADLALSPDGTRLATAVGWLQHQIFLYDLERHTLTRLSDRWDEHNPMWSPDGSDVLFSSSRTYGEMFRTPADGDGQLEAVAPAEVGRSPSSFSPDGVLAFVEEGASSDIWMLPARGGDPEPYLATPANESQPQFSPDGRFVAYTSDQSGRTEIYLRRYPDSGERWQLSADGGTSPRWAGGGSELFYRSGRDILAIPVDTGAAFSHGSPQVLFEQPAGASQYFAPSPDGQRFLMSVVARPQPTPTHFAVVLGWFEEVRAAALR